MKIVVISPHRDDAAFSLGLAIDAWLLAGHSVGVVNCFTRSDYAPFSDAMSVHPNDRMTYVTALRLREDEHWVRACRPGLTLIDVNVKDAPLRLRCRIDQVCGLPVNPEDSALRKIHRAVERLPADALVLPLAIGLHVDHVTAREATLPLLSPKLPCALYEDLPYSSRPRASDEIEEIAEKIAPGYRPAFAHAPGSTAEACRRKRRVALCYDSQIDDDVTEDIANFSTRYGGRERVWANAAWCGSPLAFEGGL